MGHRARTVRLSSSENPGLSSVCSGLSPVPGRDHARSEGLHSWQTAKSGHSSASALTLARPRTSCCAKDAISTPGPPNAAHHHYRRAPSLLSRGRMIRRARGVGESRPRQRRRPSASQISANRRTASGRLMVPTLPPKTWRAGACSSAVGCVTDATIPRPGGIREARGLGGATMSRVERRCRWTRENITSDIGSI